MSEVWLGKPSDLAECRPLCTVSLQQPHGWQFVSDRVMGGCSVGQIETLERAGRASVCLSGEVSLANNGGFVQIRRDWPAAVPAAEYQGLYLDVLGSGHAMDVRLKTAVLQHPWQSFRLSLQPDQHWQRYWLPFAEFVPHRTDAAFDPAELRSLGLVAIGAEMRVDLCLAGFGVYR